MVNGSASILNGFESPRIRKRVVMVTTVKDEGSIAVSTYKSEYKNSQMTLVVDYKCHL